MAAATEAEAMVAVSDLPSARPITERARAAASTAGLGRWERSLQLNRHLDKDDLTNGAMLLFFVPWVFIAMGIFLTEAWWDRALSISFGLIFLALGIMLFPQAWQRRCSGEAVIHLFASGAVLERTKGPIIVLPYAGTQVDHVTWNERIEGGDRPRTHFWITLPDDGIVMADAWEKCEKEDLAVIAERWGLPPTPRFLVKEPKGRPLW